MFEGNECSGVQAPTELSVQTEVISVILCVVTIPTNLLVILTIITDPLKKMNRPFNRLIVNLSVTDFLVGLVVQPLWIAIHYFEIIQDTKMFQALLKPAHCAYFLVSVASVLTITFLVVDRVIAMQKPLAYTRYLTPSRVNTICAVIWVISGVLLAFYFYKGFVVYSFIFINVAICTTFIFLAIIYVFRSLSQRRDNQRVKPRPEQPRRRTIEDIRRQRESRITGALLKMLLLFMLCYGPSGVLVYVLNLCDSCSCEAIHWMRDYSFILVLINSAVNPYLYAGSLPSFRPSLYRMLGMQHRQNNAGTSQEGTASGFDEPQEMSKRTKP